MSVHGFQYPQKPEEGTRGPEAGVTRVFEPLEVGVVN